MIRNECLSISPHQHSITLSLVNSRIQVPNNPSGNEKEQDAQNELLTKVYLWPKRITLRAQLLQCIWGTLRTVLQWICTAHSKSQLKETRQISRTDSSCQPSFLESPGIAKGQMCSLFAIRHWINFRNCPNTPAYYIPFFLSQPAVTRFMAVYK